MRKYGNAVTLLDATYRFSAYDMQLFQLCVPTNIGYLVVGAFITEIESADSIKEGLRQIRRSCLEWLPAAFMVDCDQREISAIQHIFPGVSSMSC